MRQILLSSGGAVLARVPRPTVAPGSVLVQVHYSLVSTGTELAPLKASVQDSESLTPADRALNLVSKAPDYAKKAIQNPGLAWQRAKHISLAQVSLIKQRLVPPPKPKPAAQAPFEPASLPPNILRLEIGKSSPVAWRREAASGLEESGSSLTIRTNGTAGIYQAISQPILVPHGHVLKVRARGRVGGKAMIFGTLSGDRMRWLQQLTIDEDFNEEFTIDGGHEGYIWLTWAQPEPDPDHPSGFELSVESVEGSLQVIEADGPKSNEMNDLGWGVGYSAAGQVIAVGEGVTDIKVGDMVACGGAGQANHADYIVVKQRLVARIPEGCPVKLAATTTVGAIALQGVRRADPRLGETVCVVGLGLIGLMTCQMLRANGCKVLGLDLSQDRVDRALALGVTKATTSPEEFLKIALHSTSGHGADATIITAAAKSDALIRHAMKTTRRKGRVVIVGDIGLGMERPDLYKKEIDVLISTSYGPGRYDPSYENDGIDYPYAYVRWTQNRNMLAYLELIRDGRIDIEKLIDEVVPASEAPEAYKRLANDAENSPIGVLISYHPRPLDGDGAIRGDTQIRLGGHRGPKKGRLGYVLVGAGAFGTSMLVPQMDKRKDRFDLRGVVSRDAVRGGNFARMRQLEILASDLGEVLARDDIDLVVIATRHDQHAAQAAQAIRAGKHVFVEKPLALTWEELDDVQRALDERVSGNLLMVGFNRRFAPAAQALQKAVSTRSSPMVVNYRLNGGFIPKDSWIQGKEGGGRNLGEACHMYDFFRALTGAPVTSISASAINPGDSSYLVNDNFVATLTYADGSVASLTYTANGPKTGLPKERIEVFCEDKAYVLDNFVTLYEYPSGDAVWSSDVGDKGHYFELSSFGDCIAEGAAEGPIPLEEILETTAVSLHIEDLLQGRI